MAPLTPFITERVWQDLVVPVTLAPPSRCTSPRGRRLTCRRSTRSCRSRWCWSAAGRTGPCHTRGVGRQDPPAAQPRADRRVGLRHPLPELHSQITEELNVESLASLSEVGGSLVDTTAKANFRALGKRFGKRVQDVAKAVANTDAAALSLALREGTASVEVDGETVALAPDEVIITETPREGWSVASGLGRDGGAGPWRSRRNLRRAGLARDAIRLIQEARRTAASTSPTGSRCGGRPRTRPRSPP
ncbi:DUF5915 domain-containing protein [Streptomyces thinghirensis]|nr:DUF5915 domain-containing protein [Streptomyces thinghirensis]